MNKNLPTLILLLLGSAVAPAQAQKRSEVTGFPVGQDPLAAVLPPTVQDPVVPLISLPTTFQSRRVNCDRMAPEGSNSVVLADLKGPGCVRHIWVLDADGPFLKEKFSIEVLVDGAEASQVHAPVKAFFGVMNDQEYTVINSSFAVFQNFDSKKIFPHPDDRCNPGFNTFLPIPFSKSCRITLHNPPNRHGVGMVDWHRYERGAPLTPLRFHADYRLYNPSKPRGNYAELANITGAGFIHGVQIGYDQLDFTDCLFHTAGMSILVDGETNPHAIRGHNAEDDFGVSWGFNTVQSPWLGCPWYKMRKGFNDQIGSYYRFFTTDPIVFRSSISFRTGSRGDKMESVVYSYRVPGTKAPRAKYPPQWEVSEFFHTPLDWNKFENTPFPNEFPKEATTLKTDHGWIDLHTPGFYPDKSLKKNSTYIRGAIASPRDQSATLRLAIPGWANVWVNGDRVKTLKHGYSLGPISRIPIKLRKGDNEVIILTANPNHIAFMRHWMVNVAVE